MKKISLRVIAGIIFSVIGIASLVLTPQVLMATTWLSFGNGLILSDLRFTGVDAQGNVVEKPIPAARRYAALFLIILAVLLLVLQAYLDFTGAAAVK